MTANNERAAVSIRVGENECVLDADRAEGFRGLFASATDHASFSAVLRGLASVTGLRADTGTRVTIGDVTFDPPAVPPLP